MVIVMAIIMMGIMTKMMMMRISLGDNYSAVRLGQGPWTALTLPPAYCSLVFRKYVISKILMLVMMLMLVLMEMMMIKTEEWWKALRRKTPKLS